MVTHAKPEIDFSTFPTGDGEPMAETFPNTIQMSDLIYALPHLFEAQGRRRIDVGGNQFVYYNEHNGWDHISPDVYVAFDVQTPPPPKWETWIQGKFPDIVFEITSPSTQREDLSAEPPKGKRWLYAQLGAKEYYIYDPQQVMDPPLQGFVLRAGRFEPLPMLPSGGLWSPLLGAELRPLAMKGTPSRPDGTWLRVIDPVTGQPVRIAEEDHQAFQVAQEQVSAEAQARLVAEHRATSAEERATSAEERASSEAQARLAAEERAARAEAALQALLADVARRGGGQEGTPDHE